MKNIKINDRTTEKMALAFKSYKVGRINVDQLYKSIIAIGRPHGLTIKECEAIADRLILKY